MARGDTKAEVVVELPPVSQGRDVGVVEEAVRPWSVLIIANSYKQLMALVSQMAIVMTIDQ